MNQTDLFRRLGATLKNTRWSWGAVRRDGTVFLRVWEDQTRTHAGFRYVRVTRLDRQNRKHPGHQERLEHVALVRRGAPCRMIMCVARDVNASPRQIGNFNRTELFVGGNIIELDGDWWIQIAGQISIQSASA